MSTLDSLFQHANSAELDLESNLVDFEFCLMSDSDTASSSSAATRCISVKNKMGIHARPAAMIVRLANKFQGEVFVEKDGESVNGKSIMGLMMLAAGCGSEVCFTAKGEGGEAFLDEMEKLFEKKFEEA